MLQLFVKIMNNSVLNSPISDGSSYNNDLSLPKVITSEEPTLILATKESKFFKESPKPEKCILSFS